MIKVFEKTIELADGRKITLETGKLAKQADGSVVVRMGRTMPWPQSFPQRMPGKKLIICLFLLIIKKNSLRWAASRADL